MMRATTLRRIFANGALMAASLVVALLVSEAVVRRIAPQRVYRFPPGIFVTDPVLGYRLTANFSGVADTGEYRVSIRTNALGLRDDVNFGRKEPGTYRVLAIGDSFTMAVGVELQESFLKLLESRLQTARSEPVQVIGAGVPGYNTRQALRYLRQVGLALQPDLVLLNFFVGNDIHDNFREPRVAVVDGYLRNGNQDPGLLPLWLRGRLSALHLYQLIWPYQRRLRDASFAKEETARQLAIYERDDHGRDRSEMWTATERELREASVLARDHGLALVIVLIPDQLQTDRGHWERMDPAQRAAYDPAGPNRRLAAYCQRLGLPVLDLLPSFLAGNATDGNYFPVDGHWTARGHRLAASTLHAFLTAEGLLPSVPAGRVAGRREPGAVGF